MVEGRFEQLGRRNAAVWLSTASYVEIKYVADSPNPTNMSKYRLPRAAFRKMKEDMEETQVGSDGVPAVAYKTGWLDYVRTVWVAVSDQVAFDEIAETKDQVPAETTAAG